MSLHHSKHHKSMFRRGGKIVVFVHSKAHNQKSGPIASSPFSHFRFVFRNGGEDEVCVCVRRELRAAQISLTCRRMDSILANTLMKGAP
uniref:Uncharacterized protein n=1 Tax=Parascaris equorum TaxID=6256 RepID=A0A914R9J8_PAREQ